MTPITFAIIDSVASTRFKSIANELDSADQVVFVSLDEAPCAGSVPNPIAQARHDWTLYLHPYEHLAAKNLRAFRELLGHLEPDVYTLPVPLPHSADGIELSHPEPRLVHRAGGRIDGPPLGTPISIRSMLRTDATNALQQRLVRSLETIDSTPTDPSPWMEAAALYLCLRQYGRAESAARHALVRGPNTVHVDVAQFIAHTMLRQGKYRHVLDHCRTEHSANNDSMMSHYFLARAQAQLGQFVAAIHSIDQAESFAFDPNLTADPATSEVYLPTLRAQCLAQTGQVDEALAILTNLPELNSRHPMAAYTTGLLLAKVGRDEEAITMLTFAFDHPETRANALRSAGDIHFRRGSFARAAELLEQAWNAGLRDTDMFVSWVQACEKLGDTQRIADAYEAFTAISDFTAPMLMRWGKDLAQNGEHEQAQVLLGEALRRSPDDPQIYFALGSVLQRMQMYGDAAHLFEHGLRLKPDDSEGRTGHTVCRAAMGLPALEEVA